METIKDKLDRVYDLLRNPNPELLKMSLRDVHNKGLFSLVIGGDGPGTLTRIFIVDKALKPFGVQLHTHRYPITLTSIKGDITHYVAHPVIQTAPPAVTLSRFDYYSPITGGKGLVPDGQGQFIITNYKLPPGSSLYMGVRDYHTVSAKKGAMWIVEERGFQVESSKVLGVPFVTSGLYNPPNMFEINDNVQEVTREIKKMILDYELVS